MRNVTLIFLLTSIFAFGQVTHKRKLYMLGSPFEMTVVAKDTIQGNIYIDMAVAEVKRIENLISDWIPTTQISQVSKNSGIQPVKVDKEVYDLVERAIKVSQLTSGAFDISYASMDKIWKFDGSMKAMPTPEAIKQSVARIGYQKIVLDAKAQTIYLKEKGMKLGLGGIGQGYIADKIKDLLLSKGLENSSVETSGSYEKFVVFDGKRYSHIIDPRTGYPAQGVVSVSVFAKQTEIADALATGIFVLGVDVGLNLVNQLKGIGCIIVDDKGEIHTSKNIDIKKFN